MKLHVIEGNSLRLDGGAMFGNCPKVLWSQWTTSDDQNRIPLATRGLLIQTDDGRNVLLEAGVGAFFDPRLKERFGITQSEHVLIKSLEALGLRDSDIHMVILSHLHFDHAGGLLSAFGDGEPRLLFPKARYYTSASHLPRALNPHARDSASFIPLLNRLLTDSGRLHLIEGVSHSDLDFGISFRFSEGHTPGLMVSVVEAPKGPIAFMADLAPGLPWVHLPITMGYDRYPERLIDEKKLLFDELIPRNGRLLLTHDPSIPCVSIHKDEGGRYSGKPISDFQ
jgi:glyoxylase-like metal-dependent hydrolase (beta-lactamase superfamily II)